MAVNVTPVPAQGLLLSAAMVRLKGDVIVNSCDWGGAAINNVFPFCEAVIVVVPEPTICITPVGEMVATAVLLLLYVTGIVGFELAAPAEKSVSQMVFAVIAGNWMVW